MILEPQVQKSCRKAVAVVASELAESAHSRGVNTPRWVAEPDVETVDALAGKLLFGPSISASGSAVSRLLDRCLRPSQFSRIDPLRYLKVSIDRDAEDELRRTVGDPHIGRKVRRFQRLHPDLGIEELLAEYAKVFPADHLSTGRATRALAAVIDPLVPHLPLDQDRDWASTGTDFTEAVVDRLMVEEFAGPVGGMS